MLLHCRCSFLKAKSLVFLLLLLLYSIAFFREVHSNHIRFRLNAPKNCQAIIVLENPHLRLKISSKQFLPEQIVHTKNFSHKSYIYPNLPGRNSEGRKLFVIKIDRPIVYSYFVRVKVYTINIYFIYVCKFF